MNEEQAKVREKKKREKSLFREYFELIAETAVFVFFVMTFVVQAFQIPTGSMEPTLLIGDFLLVNKLVYANTISPIEETILPHKPIRRQDIIVFKYPNDLTKDFVKRVIGLPGETLEIKNKQIYINDQPLEEKYKVHNDNQVIAKNDYYHYDDTIRDNFGPVTIPSGHVFAMGDNRDNSADSRSWGFLPMTNIKGRPWVIYFSYNAEKDAYQKTSLKDRLKKLVSFLPKARWGRMLKVIH
jgi:signal peptidase I